MSNLKKIFSFAIFAVFIVNYGFVAAAFSPAELKSEIDKRSQELKEINEQILETRNQLGATKSEKRTLQSELNQINSNLKQVDLGIKLSQTSIEKLALEIEETQFGISESEKQIINKKEAIVESLQKLQQASNSGNILTVLLSNKTLADGIFEVQGLVDFQTKLSENINELTVLKEEMGKKLGLVAVKKRSKEIENNNLKNKKIIVEDTKNYRQSILEQTKNKEKNYQQSLTELEKKQEEIGNEIFRLEEDLIKKIDRSILPTPRSGVLAIPTTGKITQNYGYTPFALAGGYKGKAHNGVDFGAPYGTPIFAAEKGKVIAVANQDLYCYKGAYGKFAAIEHENNLTTLYAHLSMYAVKEGESVERGDLIGYVGTTGYAIGSHLHFGVYATQTFRIDSARLNCGPKMPYGGSLNPADYL